MLGGTGLAPVWNGRIRTRSSAAPLRQAFSDFEMARRADLLAQYPQHKDVTQKLTRPQ
jgi:hypothetical protein